MYLYNYLIYIICIYSLEKEGELKTSTDLLKSEKSKRREAESRLTKLEDEISELGDSVTDLNKVRDQW